MPAPEIDSKARRYVASFTVLLLAIGGGTALAVAVPRTMPYHGVATWAIIVVSGLIGVYGMLRIEEGPGPFARRLRGGRT